MEDLLAQVRSILSGTPARWLNLAQTVPASLLARPAAPGQWSAVQCLQHLIDTEALFQSRVQAFPRRAGLRGF